MKDLKLICVLPLFRSEEEKEVCKFTYEEEYFNNLISDLDVKIFQEYIERNMPLAQCYKFEDSFAVYCPDSEFKSYFGTLFKITYACCLENKVFYTKSSENYPVLVGNLYNMLPTRERYNLGKSKYDIENENSIIM